MQNEGGLSIFDLWFTVADLEGEQPRRQGAKVKKQFRNREIKALGILRCSDEIGPSSGIVGDFMSAP